MVKACHEAGEETVRNVGGVKSRTGLSNRDETRRGKWGSRMTLISGLDDQQCHVPILYVKEEEQVLFL